jgi:hypothetical protein
MGSSFLASLPSHPYALTAHPPPHAGRSEYASPSGWTGARHGWWPSGLYPLIKDQLPGGASRLAALLLPYILPVCSVVAPCHPGAALRNLVLVQRIQATSEPRSNEDAK